MIIVEALVHQVLKTVWQLILFYLNYLYLFIYGYRWLSKPKRIKLYILIFYY